MASASAPVAAIEMAACADPTPTFLAGSPSRTSSTSAGLLPLSEHQLWPVRNRETAAVPMRLQFRLSQAVTEGVFRLPSLPVPAVRPAVTIGVAEATHASRSPLSLPRLQNVFCRRQTYFSDTYSGTMHHTLNSSTLPPSVRYFLLPESIGEMTSCAGALLSATWAFSPTYG